MESTPPEKQCSFDCPHRRRDGVTLTFGKQSIHLDPFEILLFALIAALPVGISIRDAWDGKLEFKESIERIAAISALGCLVRMSPTEQVSNFLSNFHIGKK
ncbi:hypothetical protein [Dendronalium sp. ChiSLP03b]|uniref:hypothetical protein n=1 Tax=Dendronalium sp. ChiSLP03b TaxID=3075381 RepID=UPI00391ACF12